MLRAAAKCAATVSILGLKPDAMTEATSLGNRECRTASRSGNI